MKKLIVLLCIYYVCCNMTSCMSEKDTSKCGTHKIEISDYSCFKLKNVYGTPYPDKAEEQKSFWKLTNGILKEYSTNACYNFSIPEKSFYKKGEVVTLKNATCTEEDKKILNNKNTCFYQLLGKYSDNITLLREGYKNVTDPNICFNIDIFNDLKGILNCGLANISYIINNKTKKINTCFFFCRK